MHKITATVLNDQGYDQAILGISLCHKIEVPQARKVALKLAFMDGGHNKFLEEIQLWTLVRAPRYLWQEMDTYRLSSKQSESTMHTLVNELKRLDAITDGLEYDAACELWIDDNFECPEQVTTPIFREMERLAVADKLQELKSILPEGFLQRRMWHFSYKTFRNMILQRRKHRLPHWPDFLTSVLGQIEHPELLPEV